MEPRLTIPAAAPLTQALDCSDRFHRDTALGRIFHPAKVSFREIAPTDSLHIIIDGRRLSVHVDRISPLKCRNDKCVGYSWTRVIAHNVVGMRGDLLRLLSRSHPNRRASVELEVGQADEDAAQDTDAVRRAEHYLFALSSLVEQDPSAMLAS